MLIIVGAVILATGVVLLCFGKLGFGRLPGDFVIKRGNVRFYFPLMTSIILSFVLSLVFWLLQRK